MDPTLIYGPYGAIALLVIAVVNLYRENTALRGESMKLLKQYQERDDEDRRLRQEEERRWHSENEAGRVRKPS